MCKMQGDAQVVDSRVLRAAVHPPLHFGHQGGCACSSLESKRTTLGTRSQLMLVNLAGLASPWLPKDNFSSELFPNHRVPTQLMELPTYNL